MKEFWQAFRHWFTHDFTPWSAAYEASGTTLFNKEVVLLVQHRDCKTCGLVERRII